MHFVNGRASKQWIRSVNEGRVDQSAGSQGVVRPIEPLMNTVIPNSTASE